MTSAESTPSVGRRLLDLGWRQGALLSAQGTEHAWARRRVEENGTGAHWEWVKQPPREREWWVIASQDCDIAAKAEARIELLRAFWTADRGEIRMARLNSARRHLLALRTRESAGQEGLIADATVRVCLEKESLLELRPSYEEAQLAPEAKRRFGEWLARRYSRPALTNAVVNTIQKPLVESLRPLKPDDPLWLPLDEVEEIRFSVPEDSPPFNVSLVCILARGRQMNPLDEAEVRGWFSDVLDKKERAQLVAVEFRSLESISLADYLDWKPLSLDEFSQEEEPA